MMPPGDEGYDFFEALDRLELELGDFANIDLLRDRLTDILGGFPSPLQEAKALELLSFRASQTQMEAIQQGFFLNFFERQGRGVAVLRDSRGRFVTEGTTRIQDRLTRGAG